MRIDPSSNYTDDVVDRRIILTPETIDELRALNWISHCVFTGYSREGTLPFGLCIRLNLQRNPDYSTAFDVPSFPAATSMRMEMTETSATLIPVAPSELDAMHEAAIEHVIGIMVSYGNGTYAGMRLTLHLGAYVR